MQGDQRAAKLKANDGVWFLDRDGSKSHPPDSAGLMGITVSCPTGSGAVRRPPSGFIALSILGKVVRFFSVKMLPLLSVNVSLRISTLSGRRAI